MAVVRLVNTRRNTVGGVEAFVDGSDLLVLETVADYDSPDLPPAIAAAIAAARLPPPPQAPDERPGAHPFRVFRPQQHTASAGGGEADDTPALLWAWNEALKVGGCVDLGCGKYRITQPMPRGERAISVVGWSPNHTWIYVDPSLAGDVISFRETWFAADGGFSSTATTRAPGAQGSGVYLANFSIVGDRSTTQVQNGIVFVDRNDNVRIQNVDVQYIKGHGIALGGLSTRTPAKTWTRESQVMDCQVRWCGDSATGRPAFIMDADNWQAGDDASNYITVRNLKAVYSDGQAVRIDARTTAAAQIAGIDFECFVDGGSNLSAAVPAVLLRGGIKSSRFLFRLNGIPLPSDAYAMRVQEGAINGQKLDHSSIDIHLGNLSNGLHLQEVKGVDVTIRGRYAAGNDVRVDTATGNVYITPVGGALAEGVLTVSSSTQAAPSVTVRTP